MRILFITANRIGDAVLTTGLLAWLEKTYPDARFTIACGPVAADLFRAVPRLDALILLKKEKYNGHWIKLWKACVGTRWDIIIDLRNSLVTRLLAAKKKHYRLAHNSGGHKVADHASVLGLTPPPAPHIWTSAEAQARAKTLIPDGAFVIAMGPAANWPPKQWPIEKFIALAHALRETQGAGVKFAIAAAPQEREQVQPLIDALGPDSVIDLIGMDLMSAAAVLQRCRLFIGNDSGLMHMAAAVGTKTLGLFGPGWEKVYGPYGAHTAVVRTPEASQELLDKLPYAGAFAPNLMDTLEVETVHAAVKKMLG